MTTDKQFVLEQTVNGHDQLECDLTYVHCMSSYRAQEKKTKHIKVRSRCLCKLFAHDTLCSRLVCRRYDTRRGFQRHITRNHAESECECEGMLIVDSVFSSVLVHFIYPLIQEQGSATRIRITARS